VWWEGSLRTLVSRRGPLRGLVVRGPPVYLWQFPAVMRPELTLGRGKVMSMWVALKFGGFRPLAQPRAILKPQGASSALTDGHGDAITFKQSVCLKRLHSWCSRSLSIDKDHADIPCRGTRPLPTIHQQHTYLALWAWFGGFVPRSRGLKWVDH
jgi:hypothetical protein